jgi:hypothetical protein
VTGHCIVGRSQRCDPGQIKRKGDNVDTSKTKPDLMSGASRVADSKRILARLEHGPRPAPGPARTAGWTIDGWTIGLCVLLVLMCSVAWMMHDRRITPDTFRHGYSSGSTTARKTATPSVPVSDAGPDEQAAAIINVAPSAASDDDTGETQSATKTQATRGAPDATPAASSTTAAMSAAMQPRATAAAQHKPALRAPSAPSAPSTQDRPTAPASGDTDVTLLTALVAHANKPAAVTPERSRDIVERREGDSTAQLLARCKQLGMIEGMLCRSRICSGRWENDTACRAPAH